MYLHKSAKPRNIFANAVLPAEYDDPRKYNSVIGEEFKSIAQIPFLNAQPDSAESWLSYVMDIEKQEQLMVSRTISHVLFSLSIADTNYTLTMNPEYNAPIGVP